jgi:serine/threonine protein kinase
MSANRDSSVGWTKSDFIFKRQLGVGQFGVVYEAMEKYSNFPVAIKIINKNKITSETLYKRLKREVEIHCRLKF